MKRPLALILLLLVALNAWNAKPAWAQKTSIQLDSDIRIFTMLAALHQAGLQFEEARPHPVQSAISREFNELPQALREKIQNSYREHTFGLKPEEIMSRYISLALLCEGPPSFKLALPLTNLPPDAQSVYEFLEFLPQFYAAGHIEAVWSRYRQAYEETLINYRPVINQLILTTDGYLRIPSGSFLDRELYIIPELQVPPNSFNARTYAEKYYLVFGPSESLKKGEIRHQYLHFILDHYAFRYTLPREVRTELAKFAETAPNLESQYRNDLQFLVTESLIRAVEMRMNKVPEPQVQVELNGYIRAGALLTRYFYEALPAFEISGEGLRVAYPNLIKSVQMQSIQAAFEVAQKQPAPPAAPDPSETEKLLSRADASLGNNDLKQAKELFQTVLASHDSANGQALYGLGIAASMENDRESARSFFEKALQSPSSDNSIKVWAHIYLARLHDVEGERERALQEYRAAVDIGDNTRNAQDVAQRGLNKPFGRDE
jgi:tetratricopeptide (TPR) repeat protein